MSKRQHDEEKQGPCKKKLKSSSPVQKSLRPGPRQADTHSGGDEESASQEERAIDMSLLKRLARRVTDITEQKSSELPDKISNWHLCVMGQCGFSISEKRFFTKPQLQEHFREDHKDKKERQYVQFLIAHSEKQTPESKTVDISLLRELPKLSTKKTDQPDLEGGGSTNKKRVEAVRICLVKYCGDSLRRFDTRDDFLKHIKRPHEKWTDKEKTQIVNLLIAYEGKETSEGDSALGRLTAPVEAATINKPAQETKKDFICRCNMCDCEYEISNTCPNDKMMRSLECSLTCGPCLSKLQTSKQPERPKETTQTAVGTPLLKKIEQKPMQQTTQGEKGQRLHKGASTAPKITGARGAGTRPIQQGKQKRPPPSKSLPETGSDKARFPCKLGYCLYNIPPTTFATETEYIDHVSKRHGPSGKKSQISVTQDEASSGNGQGSHQGGNIEPAETGDGGAGTQTPQLESANLESGRRFPKTPHSTTTRHEPSRESKVKKLLGTDKRSAFFQCKICGETRDLVMKMEKHVKETHGNLMCRLCKSMFDTSGELKSHLTEMHPGGSHKCHQCPRTFPSQNSLASHVTSTHIKEKPLSCNFCFQVFSTEDEFTEHMIDIHQKRIIGIKVLTP